MRTRRDMLGMMSAVALCGCSRNAKTVDLFVQTDGDFMAFKPDRLSVAADARVRLTFHHAGAIISQKHDWVLVQPGTMQAVDQAGQKAGEANGFVPPNDPRVIAFTRQIGKGETTSVEFTAPAPGDYPFFCSTPGHAEDMHGILHVTAN